MNDFDYKLLVFFAFLSDDFIMLFLPVGVFKVSRWWVFRHKTI